MISYELSLTLSVVGVLMIANTLSLAELVTSQQGTWFGFIPKWNIFLQPVAFIVYVISAIAETNRLPFDLAESEQELVGGLAHRIQFDEVRHVYAGRVRQYGHRFGAGDDHVPWRLEGADVRSRVGFKWCFRLVWFVMKISFFIFFYVLCARPFRGFGTISS